MSRSILDFGIPLPRGQTPTQTITAIDASPSAETARERRNRLARERRARRRQTITPEQRAATLEARRIAHNARRRELYALRNRGAISMRAIDARLQERHSGPALG